MVNKTILPLTLEYSLDKVKDKSAARRQKVLLKAAPQIQALRKKLIKMSCVGLEDIEEDIGGEALKFYNSVVEDGRYVRLLKTNPQSAAEKLGKKISPQVTDAISIVSKRIKRAVGENEGPVEAVIAVAVVVAVALSKPGEGIVIDDKANVRMRL